MKAGVDVATFGQVKWKHVRTDWDPNCWWGGVALFERVA
jgi:hypothetical protein